MLIVVSPAKTLDYESPLVTSRFTQPELLDHSAALITRARQLSPDQIASLMKISDKLAGLNAARFAEWQPDFTPANARQALLAFKGDVYTGLAVEDFSEADLDFACGKRNADRLVYSSDGLRFVTVDHYRSFHEVPK